MLVGCAACAGAPGDAGGALGGSLEAAGATDTGGYDIAPMIFNGASSAEGAVVALVDANGALVCSGTAVRQDIVLTAAHCLDGITIAEALEGSNVAAPVRRYPALRTAMHPNYNRFTTANDIGVVQLGAPFQGPLMNIGLPRAGLGQVAVGSSLRVVGFGFDQNNVSGRRREATVTLNTVQPRVAFVSNTTAGACPGDSGGPLIANIGGRNRAVGVVSGVVPPINPAANPCVGDGVYTRVDAYLAWLSTF
jgi:secreted trypsin-like serine protease